MWILQQQFLKARCCRTISWCPWLSSPNQMNKAIQEALTSHCNTAFSRWHLRRLHSPALAVLIQTTPEWSERRHRAGKGQLPSRLLSGSIPSPAPAGSRPEAPRPAPPPKWRRPGSAWRGSARTRAKWDPPPTRPAAANYRSQSAPRDTASAGEPARPRSRLPRRGDARYAGAGSPPLRPLAAAAPGGRRTLRPRGGLVPALCSHRPARASKVQTSPASPTSSTVRVALRASPPNS